MRKGLLLVLIIIVAFFCCAKKNLSDEAGIITSQDDTPGNIAQSDTVKAEIIKGNSIKDSGITDTENHTGTFEVKMGAYKGEVFIGVADNAFYGTILFYNWGNGTPQPLKNLKVNEDRIYFIRSLTTREEIEKYGGTAAFKQEFYGIFSKDRKIIRGYYRYAGTQDSWEAVKK